jgi:hypothetical protein
MTPTTLDTPCFIFTSFSKGVKMDRIYLTSKSSCKQQHSALISINFSISLTRKQKQLETANIQCSRSFSLSLFNIPQELLKEILSHMAPHDLTKLFSCSKKLKGELQKMFAGNELFWHNYHNKYFHCVEEQQGPYRTKVQQRLK